MSGMLDKPNDIKISQTMDFCSLAELTQCALVIQYG